MKRISALTVAIIIAITGFSQTIVGGTTFEQSDGYSDWGWDFASLEHLGPSGNTISTPRMFMSDAADFLAGENAWVIVDNPFKLGTNTSDATSALPDIDDDMFVTTLAGLSGNSDILRYMVKGLKPGSEYSATFTFYLLYTTKTNSWDASAGFMVGVPDAYGNMNGGKAETGTIGPTKLGIPIEVTYTGTVPALESSVEIAVKLGYNSDGAAIIGISDVRIEGVPNPKVISGQGLEMCRGEQTLLTIDRDYGTAVTWEESTNGSSWTQVPSTKPNLYREITAPRMFYRASVGGAVSEPLEISTITCCESEVGGKMVYSSRETIFLEDFGYFDGPYLYTDAEGNTKTMPSSQWPYRSNVSFSLPSTAGTYAAIGEVNDGSYSVTMPTADGGFCNNADCSQRAGWMKNVITDHSSLVTGKEGGAYLLINVNHNFKGSIFSRTIDNLCEGRALTFETYVADISGQGGAGAPLISLTVVDGIGKQHAKIENVRVEPVDGWKRISIDNIILQGTTSLTFNVESHGENWTSGQDIGFDDIKVMACSSPALDLFSDVANLERISKVCSSPFTLGSVASGLLTEYYGSDLAYVFQYSRTPGDDNSWTQIAPPGTASEYTIDNPRESPIFAGIKTGQSVYFRVVAANSSVLNSTPVFSATNYCKNYSISPIVQAEFECPTCTNPQKITIDVSDQFLCEGETAVLTPSSQLDASTFSYTWYEGSTSGNVVAGPTTAATLPLSLSRSDIGNGMKKYWVVVRDVKFPTLTACQTVASAEVYSLNPPAITMNGGGTYCEGETVDPIYFEFDGFGPFNLEYKINGGTAITVSDYDDVELYLEEDGQIPSDPGTYVYTVSAFSDECEADDISTTQTISINPKPKTNIPAVDAVCEGTPVDLVATPIAGATYEWKKAGAKITSATGATYSLPSPTTPTQSGEYSITPTLNGCVGDPATVQVTVNPKPEITTLTADNTSICSGDEIKLSATVTVTGGTATWTNSTPEVSGIASVFNETNTTANPVTTTIKLDYETAEGCKAAQKTIDLTVNPIPAAPQTTNASYCVDATAEPMTARVTAAAGCTLKWYGENATGGTASATAPTISTATASNKTYYVSQVNAGGCESERSAINIIVNSSLSPTITLTETSGTANNDGVVCKGLPIAISLDRNYASATWSGTAAAQLTATDILNPTFKATATENDYTLSVLVTDENQCKGTASVNISVKPVPTATLSTPINKCAAETATQTITATVVPAMSGGVGTWTGATKVTETAATFSPSDLGKGNHDFSFSYVCEFGCEMATPATTSVEVYEMPSITITPSLPQACESGSAVTNITMAMNGTYAQTGAQTPSYSYTSATLSGVNATNGSFAVAGQTAQSHEISLAFTDANGCAGTASTNVVINARPVADISENIAKICDYDNAVNLVAKINGAVATGGTFSGPSVASNAFTPSTQIKGENTITYNYTDANGCAAEQVSHTITVNHADEPVVTSASDSRLNVTSQATVPSVSATGTNIQWYDNATATGTPLGTNNEYQHPFVDKGDGKMEDGTYSAWATQTVEGCVSAPVLATLTITNCKAKAPLAKIAHACDGSNAGQVTSEITSQSATGRIFAFANRTDVPIVTVADPTAITNLGEITNSLAIPYNGTGTYATGEIVLYVAEYIDDDQCFSAPTEVRCIVHEKPNPSITDPGMICYTSGDVTLNYSPKTSGAITTELSGTGISGDKWTPQFTADITGVTTTTVTITTQEVWAEGTVQENTCENSATLDLKVTNVLAPTTTDITWSSSKIDLLPAMNITYNKADGATLSVKNASNAEIGTESPLTMYPTHITVEGEYDYTLTQTLNGCESPASTTTWKIVDCPTPAPSATDLEICQNDNLPSFTATGTGIVFEWNNESDVKISEGATLDLSTIAAYSSAEAKTYTFKVRQDGDDGAGGRCFGPYKDVTLTINPLPTITIDVVNGNDELCYAGGKKTASAQVNGTSSALVSGGVWEIVDNTGGITPDGGVIDPTFNGKKSEDYTIKYTFTDAKSCVNSATRNISVIYLSAPEVKDFYAMTTQTNPVTVEVTSTLDADAKAQWFANELSTATSLGEGTVWQTGDQTNRVLEKTYYARQFAESAGCYSEPTAATVRIVECPIPNVMVGNEVACIYQEVPTLVATSGNWAERDAALSKFRFYASESSTTPAESVSGQYQPSLTSAGEYSYLVSEYNSTPLIGLTHNEGCEGPKVRASITINETAAPTIRVTPESVCYATPNPQYSATATAGEVYWFEENPGEKGNPTTMVLGKGVTYVPENTEVGSHNVWAVALNNECYSTRAVLPYNVMAIPDAPQVEDLEICYGEKSASTLTAIGEANSYINWYLDEAKSIQILANSSSYTSLESSPNKYSYFASQVVANCESKTAEVVFTIKPLPNAPFPIAQPNLCEYDAAPNLSVSGENIQWFADEKGVNKLGDGEMYQVTELTTGSHKYYASQTVEGCQGPLVTISFFVNRKPETPTPTGAMICEGATEIPTLTTALMTDCWFAEPEATTLLAKGYTYTPEAAMISNESVPFYVRRELNSCFSDVATVWLEVVKKPVFSIGFDTVFCEYEEIPAIQASEFEPAINATSFVDWSVSNGKISQKYLDNTAHNILPINMMNGAGDYTVKAVYNYRQDLVACPSDTIDINYNIIARARKPIVFSTVICQGEDIKDLRALGSRNIQWTSLSGARPEFCIGQHYVFDKKQVLEPGEYRFAIFDRNIYDEENDLGCESLSDTVTMTVAPAAETKLIGVDSVCVGATESYYTMYTPESNYFWKVTGDNLNYSKDAMSSSVRYVDWIKPGVDTLTVYEQTWAGCEGFDTLVVKIAAVPEPMFSWSMPGAINIIELTDSTKQDSLTYVNEFGEKVTEEIPYKMAWNYGYQGTPESQIDTVIPYEKRNYSLLRKNYLYGYNCPILTVTNDFGCVAQYTECIFVNVTSTIYMPNAFAPMNPAHSVRNFQPKGYNIRECEVWVYDKWGNLLWFGNKVEDGKFVDSWDGTYEGKPMASDVYIWKMRVEFLDGQIWEGFDNGNGKKSNFGNVTLIR